MWLVVGLGNPGDKYADTRHNAGFMVVDYLAAGASISLKLKTSEYIFGKGFIGDQKAVLIKPLTFMNRSGLAVMQALRKFEDIENILIIHDDLDLEPGILRIKKSGSSGGHNGIKSIIEVLGSKDFNRLKVGIGRPGRGPTEKYVLKAFNKSEWPVMEEAIERAGDAVHAVLNQGIAQAQNIFHRDASSQ